MTIVDLDQSLCFRGFKWPRTIEEAQSLVNTKLVTILEVSPTDYTPRPAWGHGIYRIQQDGTLKVWAENFDSSG